MQITWTRFERNGHQADCRPNTDSAKSLPTNHNWSLLLQPKKHFLLLEEIGCSSLVLVRKENTFIPEILRLFDYPVCTAASVLCYLAADSLCILFSSSKMMIFQDKDISPQNPKVVGKMESQLPWSLRMEDIPRSLMWSKTKSFFSAQSKTLKIKGSEKKGRFGKNGFHSLSQERFV